MTAVVAIGPNAKTDENVKQAVRSLILNGHFGFDGMPEQLTHKSMGFNDVHNENKPLSFQEFFKTKRNHHFQKLQNCKDEMRQMFIVRVKEKEAELKEAEKELHDKLKRDQNDQKRRLEEQRRKYEDDLMEFNKRKQEYMNMGHHTLTFSKRKKK